VLMVALGVIPLAYFYTCRTVGAYILLTAAFMTAALVTLTKTAMAGLLMLALAIPAIDMFVAWLRFGSLSVRSMKYTIAASLVVVCAGIVTWWFILTTGFFDRVSFFFARGGWSAVAFSGRDTMVEAAAGKFLSASAGTDLLVGKGVLWLSERLGGQTESDFVDFGLAFGLPSAVLMFAALGIICLRAFAAVLLNPEFNLLAGVMAVFCALAIAIALLAGHVLNSGTAAATVGTVLATWRAGLFLVPELRWRV
jgi:hypothetical protein